MPVFYVLIISFSLISISGFAFIFLTADFLPSVLLEFNLMTFFGVKVTLPLLFDFTSLSFGVTVLVISGSVLYFSKFYMSKEKYFLRFHLLVCSFIFSMLLLIFSPNLVSLILGWDGLGVTSFLLVVYFNSHKSFNAGMLTALTNRLGDCLLLLAIAVLMNHFPFNFFLGSQHANLNLPVFLAGLVMIAACTKSAQIPFSAWLPAAMAAPTPVSSLVHSSTLVTAGVYLLLRFNQFLSLPFSKGLFILGVSTMTMASLSALFETDMKKIIALSTLSQLGLMMSGIGMNMLELTLFHLLTHAYFKASMFMAVGSIIHVNSGIQDLRITGVKSTILGPSLGFLMVANFSLMGLPYMSGFYSKDLLIEASLTLQMTALEELIFYISVALSAAYSVRFMLTVIWGSLSFNSLSWIEDSDKSFFWSMIILWGLAIIGGSLLSWIWVSPHSFVIPNSLKILVFFMILAGAGAIPNFLNPKFSSATASLSRSVGSLWALADVSPSLTIPGYLVAKPLYSKLDSSFIPAGLGLVFYAPQWVSLIGLKAIHSLEWTLFSFVLLFVLLTY